MTQVELAEALGVNTMTIKRWENGKNWPGDLSFEAMAEVFGVPVQEFFLGPMSKKDLNRVLARLHSEWGTSSSRAR